MIELLGYGFMQKALIGGIAIAISCGVLGPFLVLRRLSLLGDGLAHLAFGGIALGLLLGINPLIAALATVALGAVFVQKIIKDTYGDAAISLILSFGVGLGIIVIGIARGFNANLFSYLIGSILALTMMDIAIILLLLACVVVFVTVFYRQLIMLTFSEELAEIQNRKTALISNLFIVLVAMIVAISIRAVGILLVTALIVMPTLVALHLAGSFRKTLVLAVFFSMLAVVLGIVTAYYLNLPPSGAIVLVLFCTYFLSHFIGRAHGSV